MLILINMIGYRYRLLSFGSGIEYHTAVTLIVIVLVGTGKREYPNNI